MNSLPNCVEVIQQFISETLDEYGSYLVAEGIDEKLVAEAKKHVMELNKIVKKSPAKVVEDDLRCKWISVMTTKEDKRCEKKCAEGGDYCKTHQKMMDKREEKEAHRCSHTTRTGNQCKSTSLEGTTLCKKHTPAE